MPFELSEKSGKSALKEVEGGFVKPESKPVESIDDLRYKRVRDIENSSEATIKTGEERFNQVAESMPLENKDEFEQTKQETREELDSNTEEIRNLSSKTKEEIIGYSPEEKAEREQLTPHAEKENEQAELLRKPDRDLLKKMTEETTGAQEVRYGREFNLDSDKREQLGIVTQIVKNSLESKKQDNRWKKLQELIEEGSAKGVLMAFTFPPAWLVDGGKDAAVQKIKLADGRPGIQVPSEIYNLYYWDTTINCLKETVIEQSDNALRGRSARHLNKTLVELSGFFKESGLIK